MNRYRGFLLAAMLGVGWAVPATGAPVVDEVALPPGGILRDAAGHVTVRAVRLVEPLTIDGKLDEEVYRVVQPIDTLIQTVPHPGDLATERTEMWVMFDTEAIYVTARCWESTPPERWVADEMKRDSGRITSGDVFGLLFDTFYDRRNGYAFATNPLGARFEAQYFNEGLFNVDFNPVWDVGAGRFAGGWIVEMAVPFKSLRYRSGTNQTWGLQLRRGIARKGEWGYLTRLPPSLSAISPIRRISEAATLIGLDLPPATRNVELKPYITSGVSAARTRTAALANELNTDVGGDFKYGITANLTADLTYNTDFAQVEVDEQQVNLTRFNLLFPEKRDFFLEGRTIFEFGRGSGLAAAESADTPSLFYSRRIGLAQNQRVPVEVGGRLTGKVGAIGIGVMNIHTGDEPLASAKPTNFTVVRLQRDVLRRSSVGAMFTNRSVSATGIGSNQAYGVDANFRLFQDVTMSGYAARTQTSGLDGNDGSYEARIEYGADRYGARLEYLAVGDSFNPEVGFVRRNDFKQLVSVVRFSPRPRRSEVVRQYSWEGGIEYTESGAGYVEARQQFGRFRTEFQSNDQVEAEVTNNFERLVRPFPIGGGVLVSAGAYDFAEAKLTYTFRPQRRLSGIVRWQVGRFYDGTRSSLEFSRGRLSLAPNIAVAPSLSLNRVTLPNGVLTATVARVRTEYNFTPWMFASALVQYNSTDRTFGSNIRFRWEYRPGSDLFVVYTDEWDVSGPGFATIRNRAFVVKMNRLFRF